MITEYGIAELRGRTGEQVIAALLNVADPRFQDELLARAQAAGKIGCDYRIPAPFLPQRLAHSLQPLQARGFFSEYPFGTDLTAEEVARARALKFLEAHTAGSRARLRTLAAALMRGRAGTRHAAALKRMGLELPRALSERLQQRLLVLALQATAPTGSA